MSGMTFGGDQIRDASVEEVDLSAAVADKLLPGTTGIPGGYAVVKDESSPGKRKWAAVGSASIMQLIFSADWIVTAGYGAYVPDMYEIGAGFATEIGAESVLEVG